MMQLPIYQIDAFAEKLFEGNPAAVVPLEQWLPDATMQAIAQENNLAETAFFIPTGDGFYIRWFTPNKEVNLCGHATLASAYVVFHCLGYQQNEVVFDSLSGPLSVTQIDNMLTLDFPSQKPEPCEAPAELIEGLGQAPVECYSKEDFLAVFESETDVLGINPNFNQLDKLDLRGVIATAPSSEYDFVARFFAPKYGIPEDSVTGSAYTQLTPYWAGKMGKTKFIAMQASPRTGTLQCELAGNRVFISGYAVKYMEGVIEIPRTP